MTKHHKYEDVCINIYIYCIYGIYTHIRKIRPGPDPGDLSTALRKRPLARVQVHDVTQSPS